MPIKLTLERKRKPVRITLRETKRKHIVVEEYVLPSIATAESFRVEMPNGDSVQLSHIENKTDTIWVHWENAAGLSMGSREHNLYLWLAARENEGWPKDITKTIMSYFWDVAKETPQD